MTARALTDDFPLRSALAVRAPRDVAADELRLELEQEAGRRRKVYPALIARGALKEEDADHQQAVWAAMIADLRRDEGLPTDRYVLTWEARIRELRRELALRRNAYPKWIDSPTNPLTAADAQRHLERLDAVHWWYWMELFAFAPDGRRAADDARRAHHIALRELARREPAIDAAIREGGATAALGERLRNHLIVLARLAAAIDAGRVVEDVVTWSDLFRIADTLNGLLGTRLGDTGPVATAELGQLWQLDRWLHAVLNPRPIAVAPIERLAA